MEVPGFSPAVGEPVTPLELITSNPAPELQTARPEDHHLFSVPDDIPHNRYVIDSVQDDDKKWVPIFADMSPNDDVFLYRLFERCPNVLDICFPKHVLEIIKGERDGFSYQLGRGNVTRRIDKRYFQRRAGSLLLQYGYGESNSI